MTQALLLPGRSSNSVQVPAPTGNAETDTTAVASAAGTGANLLEFQAGTYSLTGGAHPQSKQRWNGQGIGVTTLKLAKNAGADLVVNADQVNGNDHVTISNMTLDGNKAEQLNENNHHCLHLVRCPNFVVVSVEVQNADGHGASFDGNGVVTRIGQVVNLTAHDCSQMGVRGTFAQRNVEYSNITAYKCGLHGIQFDHSELVATNIEARENTGRGVFIRNIFAGVFNDFRSTLNGEDGIYVQGMVYSIGNNWLTGGNSTKTENTYNEATFSGSGALSYGITNEAIINNLQANPNSELGNKSKHCLFIGDPTEGAASGGSLKIIGNFGTGQTGSIRIPAAGVRGNLGIIDWPAATSNLRWWAGTGLATPNGMIIGTAATHLLGFFGATPVVQPATIAELNPATATAKECAERLNEWRTKMKALGLIA